MIDCTETTQEWSLGYVVVHLGFGIFKMSAVAMVTMKVKKKFYQIIMKLHGMILMMCRSSFRVEKFQNRCQGCGIAMSESYI